MVYRHADQVSLIKWAAHWCFLVLTHVSDFITSSNYNSFTTRRCSGSLTPGDHVFRQHMEQFVQQGSNMAILIYRQSFISNHGLSFYYVWHSCMAIEPEVRLHHATRFCLCTTCFHATCVVCCKNKLAVLPTVVNLVATSWKASEAYFGWKTNWIRQPMRQLLSSSSNHNTLTIHWQSSWGNHLLALKTWKLLTATLNCICNDSFTYVLRVICVLWL